MTAATKQHPEYASDLHPADELARIRAEIRRLAAREAALCEDFTAGRARRIGTHARVDLRETRSLTFRHDRLPTALLQDPRFWDVETRPVVTVLTHDSLAPAPRRPARTPQSA